MERFTGRLLAELYPCSQAHCILKFKLHTQTMKSAGESLLLLLSYEQSDMSDNVTQPIVLFGDTTSAVLTIWNPSTDETLKDLYVV